MKISEFMEVHILSSKIIYLSICPFLLSPFLILICSGHSQNNKKREAYCVRLWIPPRKYFGPFSYLRFYWIIFLTRHFTVEIILYSATWSLNVTCFTFRYFKLIKESCPCISPLSLFLCPPSLPISLARGESFSSNIFYMTV